MDGSLFLPVFHILAEAFSPVIRTHEWRTDDDRLAGCGGKRRRETLRRHQEDDAVGSIWCGTD